MAFKLVHHENLLALGMILVLAHVLALFQEVVLNHFDLDDLVALPAAGENRALLPVMNVHRLLSEGRIGSSTKVALLMSTAVLLVVVGHLPSIFYFVTIRVLMVVLIELILIKLRRATTTHALLLRR